MRLYPNRNILMDKIQNSCQVRSTRGHWMLHTTPLRRWRGERGTYSVAGAWGSPRGAACVGCWGRHGAGAARTRRGSGACTSGARRPAVPSPDQSGSETHRWTVIGLHLTLHRLYGCVCVCIDIDRLWIHIKHNFHTHTQIQTHTNTPLLSLLNYGVSQGEIGFPWNKQEFGEGGGGGGPKKVFFS